MKEGAKAGGGHGSSRRWNGEGGVVKKFKRGEAGIKEQSAAGQGPAEKRWVQCMIKSCCIVRVAAEKCLF